MVGINGRRQAKQRLQQSLHMSGRKQIVAARHQRDPLQMIAASGFVIEHDVQRYAGARTPWNYFTLGVAREPFTR